MPKLSSTPLISLDTECTGLDLHHGALPFFVSTCDEQNRITSWEWPVDPFTRKPRVSPAEFQEVLDLIGGDFDLVLQNPKFDAQAIRALASEVGSGDVSWLWPWSATYDTLLAGHLLASAQPHDLTTMTLVYLGINIRPLEDALEKATVKARQMARQKMFKAKHGVWAIAEEGREDMPSAKQKTWKFDGWLPRAIAEALGYPQPNPQCQHNYTAAGTCSKCHGHSWWAVLRKYGEADAAVTLPLFLKMRKLLQHRQLWLIYQERLKILPIIQSMEQAGVVANRQRLEELETDYQQESERLGRLCLSIAKGYDYDLELPKGASNTSLRNFVFGYDRKEPCPVCQIGRGGKKRKTKRLPKPGELPCANCGGSGELTKEHHECLGLDSPIISEETGAPSLSKEAMAYWLDSLPMRGKPFLFLHSLGKKRKLDTSLNFLRSYRRFWIPLDVFNSRGEQLWYRLHPSLNPTGTATLRWSSSNPNEQQISKQVDSEGRSVRYCFGPAPGREWWSCDAKNIELRLPAYEAGEREMINLFERPKDPPYFGSYHLLVFDILHPQLFAKHGAECKDVYADTWYQWTKNGNFAVQYGAVEVSGTADRAYRVPGAQRRVQDRFKQIKKLNQYQIDYARQHGYVETMPDKTVDPRRGYPLMCARTKWGSILETVPLNYHIQGTAMWWMMKAMIRCHDYLQGLRDRGLDAWMIIQVHDELVFDFPASEIEIDENGEEVLSNLPYVAELCRLMAQGGDDISIPTPVSCKHHPQTWNEGFSVKLAL